MSKSEPLVHSHIFGATTTMADSMGLGITESEEVVI